MSRSFFEAELNSSHEVLQLMGTRMFMVVHEHFVSVVKVGQDNMSTLLLCEKESIHRRELSILLSVTSSSKRRLTKGRSR